MNRKFFGAGLLSLALVAVLSVAAFAQVTTEVNGSIEAEFTVFQHATESRPDLSATGAFDLGIGLSAGSGNVRAYVNLVEEWEGSFGGSVFGDRGLNLEVESAYIQAEGAWWIGGPSVLTTLGRHSVDYSGWVAHNVGKDGIEISGFEAGPVELDVYAGWDAGDRPVALRAAGDIDFIGFEGVLVNRGEIAGTDRVFDLAVSAGAELVDGIGIGGTFARDGETETLGYEVGAIIDTLPELTLFAEVFSAEEDFAPRYSDQHDPDVKADDKSFTADERGFTVGAATTQQGVDLYGGFTRTGLHSDQNYQKDVWAAGAATSIEGFDLSADVEQERVNSNDPVRTLELGVGYNFQEVGLKYTAVIRTGDDLKNVLEASTTQDLPYLGDVDLKGKLTLQGNNDPEVAADATWSAPNGFNLGLHYANYAKEGVRGTLADNVYLTAGIKVDF